MTISVTKNQVVKLTALNAANIKNPYYSHNRGFYIWGPVQVRTGVAAFAELSLTTRPQDLICFKELSLFYPSRVAAFVPT